MHCKKNIEKLHKLIAKKHSNFRFEISSIALDLKNVLEESNQILLEFDCEFPIFKAQKVKIDKLTKEIADQKRITFAIVQGDIEILPVRLQKKALSFMEMI